MQQLKAAYIAIRATAASDEVKLAAVQAYLAAYTTQEQTYQSAMTMTADLYHVRIRHDGPFEIQVPSDAADAYVAGLMTRWNPRVTESGPGVMLSVKIVGSDGQPHYSGATKLDPRTPGERQAITLLDGRVLILKDTLGLALEKKNPGYLARILFHESRHFDRLDWTDSKGKRRGWQNIDKEERDAYKRDLDFIKAFGLEKKDEDDIRKNHKDFSEAVRTGVPLTDNGLDPAQQAKWKDHYETIQVNIEEEFMRLAEKVAAERARQEALQKRIEEERLARERQETERRAVEAEEAVWRQLDLMASQCGYRLAYQEHSGIFMGFRDENNYFFFKPALKTTLNLNDVEVALLVSRTCRQIHEVLENRRTQPSPGCNGSAVLLGKVVAQPDFPARLDYMFGARGNRDRCIDDLFDHTSEITDSARFDKFMTLYAKQRKKEAVEYDRRWNPRTPQHDTPRRGNDNPPRDDQRRTSPDHDEVWRRINPIIR
ncbi:MAG: hypothetical protein HYX59_00045 [Elusimicrobia bacterium]|nr:hypothetical protein [Elusimicrobiota bacterium]